MDDVSKNDGESNIPQLPEDSNLANTEEKGNITQRRSPVETFLKGIKYVNDLTVSEQVQVRDTDRATSYFLLICSLVTVVSLVVPMMAPQRMPLLLVCDVLVGAMIFYYIVNRFGILTTLPARQALLCWQLMQGSLFFGIFFTINLALLVGMIVSSTHIDVQVPPPN